jgi:threonine/homoserine/homoserine lactone efflux protein
VLLADGGTLFVEWVIVLSSIVPVIGLCWFAWWFLRAGKRYDEQQRAAQRNSTPGRPPTEKPTPR